jgi:hypothetical protein
LNFSIAQEIEQEEHAERVATTAALFKKFASRCQAGEGSDFWPTAISQAAGVLPTSTATASSATPLQSQFNILEELLHPSATPAASSTDHLPATQGSKHHYSVEDLSQNQNYSQPTSTGVAATAAATPSAPPVIYITWDDVWSHIFHTLQQTVQFVAATVEERSGESPLLCAAREQKQWLADVAIDSVDSTRERCRGAMVWPQIELRRISALRYHVGWHGVTFPVKFSSSSWSKFSNVTHLRAIDLTHAL